MARIFDSRCSIWGVVISEIRTWLLRGAVGPASAWGQGSAPISRLARSGKCWRITRGEPHLPPRAPCRFQGLHTHSAAYTHRLRPVTLSDAVATPRAATSQYYQHRTTPPTIETLRQKTSHLVVLSHHKLYFTESCNVSSPSPPYK